LGVIAAFAVVDLELLRVAEGSGRKDLVLPVSFGACLLSYLPALHGRRGREGRE